MDKYKKLFNNTLIFAIGSFSSKILSFILVRFYTSQLNTPEFGVAELIRETANLLIPIATLAIYEAVIRFGLDEAYDKKKVFTNCIAAALFGMTCLALLFPFVNLIHKFDGYGFILYLYVYISGMKQICAHFVRSRGLVRLFATDGVLTTFVMLTLNIIFLLGFNMGIRGYILSIVLADLISIIFLMCAAKLPRYLDFSKLDSRFMKQMLRYSVPLIPTAVMWIFIATSDKFFITHMISDSANGIYSAANKIPQIVAVVSAFFSQAWHMSAIMEQHSAGVEKFYKKVFDAYQSVMYVVTAGILLLVRPLTALLVDDSHDALYGDAYKYTPFLVVGIMMMCFASFLSSIYAVKKRSMNSMITASAAALTNIVLNAVMIPRWGIQGAGFATCMSYFVCFAIRIFDTRRYISFDVNFRKLAVNLLLITAMLIVCLSEPSWWVIYTITFFLLIFLLNVSSLMKTVQKVLERRGSAEKNPAEQ